MQLGPNDSAVKPVRERLPNKRACETTSFEHEGSQFRATIPEPIQIAKFWKNRGRNESVHITLSEYEGRGMINVRVWQTGADGIDRPTVKGVAMGIRKLPELAKALAQAETRARELGLIDEATS